MDVPGKQTLLVERTDGWTDQWEAESLGGLTDPDAGTLEVYSFDVDEKARVSLAIYAKGRWITFYPGTRPPTRKWRTQEDE